MNKFMSMFVVAVLALVAVFCPFAASAETVHEDMYFKGDCTFAQPIDAERGLNGSVAGNMTGMVYATGWRISTTSTTVTNGQIVTLSSPQTALTGTGASDTITLANPTTTGMLYVIKVGGTNTVNIADAGSSVLCSNWAGGALDRLLVISDVNSGGTNVYAEIARSNN